MAETSTGGVEQLQGAQLHRVTQSNTLGLCAYFVVSFGAGFSHFPLCQLPALHRLRRLK